MTDQDDFYIGYEPNMPHSIRGTVAALVLAALVIATMAAAIFVTQQRQLADARFDYANAEVFEGYLSLTPTAALLIPKVSGVATYWLVAPGKFGPESALGGARAGWVTLVGKLIEREQWRMIEVRPGSVRPARNVAAAPPVAASDSRRLVLRGEIVDGKCYLGVMNPGERGVHRDCAVRCISGGVPLMFAYQDEDGAQLAMLIGAVTEAIRRDIGRTITLSGVISGPSEARVFDVSRAE